MCASPVFKANPDYLQATPSLDGDTDPKKRVYFEVFGCQMNKLDAELMVGTLMENGYSLTENIDEAGVALYVTCSVRQQAENRVISKIGSLKKRKKEDPNFLIGLLGCMAQNQPEETQKKNPHIDVICGTAEFLRLPEILDQARSEGPQMAIDLKKNLTYQRTQNLGPKNFQAFISVMRGCDMVCSFCIVPKTRGKEISKPVTEIVDEAKALADCGVREITLLGQTVNSYGKCLAPGRKIGLQHLLHELNKINGLDRIRFITSHPSFMNDDLIDAMADLEKVCEYLHLPVQSGDDEQLKAMRRGYTVDHYRKVIDKCRQRIPNFRLATDFIVGFPGETDAAFERTCDLLHEMQYQNSFTFKYSPRPDTAAFDLEDDVPEPVKQERNQRLLEIQKEISTKMYAESVGSIDKVLIEGPSQKDPKRYTGRNTAHQIVVFDAPERAEVAEGLVGKILPIQIEASTNLTLFGRLLDTEEKEKTVEACSDHEDASQGGLISPESIQRIDI